MRKEWEKIFNEYGYKISNKRDTLYSQSFIICKSNCDTPFLLIIHHFQRWSNGVWCLYDHPELDWKFIAIDSNFEKLFFKYVQPYLLKYNETKTMETNIL